MFLTGNSYTDDRGQLFFNNDLNLSEVKRMYVIDNLNIDIIRAWQAHKIEKRWFVAVVGKFEIRTVKIDNFDNPSVYLRSENYFLDSKTMDTLFVEPGFATSIQSLEQNSKLVVFSNYMIGELNDDYKFDHKKWAK